MNAHRIAIKSYQDNYKLTLKDFSQAYMHRDIMPIRAVEMCDVFIATDEHYFVVLKCRVPNIPTGQVLPLSYLKHTTDLISEWQDQ